MEPTLARTYLNSTMDYLRDNDSAYIQLADRFKPYFETRENVRAELADMDMPVPTPDADGLTSGTPILAGQDLSVWDEAFTKSVDSMLPVLAETLRMDDETILVFQKFLGEPGKLTDMVQAHLADDTDRMHDTAKQLGIHPPALMHFVVEAVASPVLYALVDRLGTELPAPPMDQAQCPICGSLPSISQLAPKKAGSGEYLVGGGGEKYLHCSHCGHDWRYKRNACAACGNEDHTTREILFAEGAKRERIEACSKCGKYILNLDMREYESPQHLDAIQMGLIHLDILARQQQLAPVSFTLWNTIE